MKTNYNKHFISLCVLFVLGNGIISLPQKSADIFTFLGFLVSFLISFLLLLLPINFKFVSFFAVWVMGDTFIDFIKFISKTLLRESPKILIVLPFILTVLVFCSVNRRAVLKFSLISAMISVMAIFFFFGFTASDFNIKNIIIKAVPDLKNLYTQTMPYFKKVTLPSFLLLSYAKLNGFSKKTAFCGMALGNALLAFCILNSVLLFGSSFAGRLDFPYAFAISTVTFGNLFTRMDGFAYFIYFASCLIKITISAQIIKATLRSLYCFLLRFVVYIFFQTHI